MRDQPTPHHRALAAASFLLITVLACSPAAETQAPTVVALPDVSLAPADDTAAPDAMPILPELPSVPPPPSGVPVPPDPDVDYTFDADDLEAFLAAYQEAFPEAGVDRGMIASAGASLCTYLMRHADGDGVVSLDDAMVEADLNEPGYSREAWLLAFEIATASYCGQFTIDFETGV